MDVFYTDIFDFPLPPGHRFPKEKYLLLRQRLQEHRVVPLRLRIAPAVTREMIDRVHCPEHIDRLLSGGITRDEERRLGLPWSPQLWKRALHSAGATLAACESALQGSTAAGTVGGGFSASLAGGTHHAFRDRIEGFCILNDAVIAARELQARGRVQRVLVVDGDVHQGNGTAALTEHDASIVTFSIHARNNYPADKERSTVDIELDDGAGDEEYLQQLQTHLPQLMAATDPDLVIYIAGADPHEEDRLGRLGLSLEGLGQRDRAVFDISNGKPMAITMGGGYGREVATTVAIQAQTILEAARRSQSRGRL